jgi:hypothetical protein
MKKRWKKLVLWSSLGGFAVGTAVALSRRSRAPELPGLDVQRIPNDCQRFSLWTDQFKVPDGEALIAVQDKYVLQLTPFKTWDLYQLGQAEGKPKSEGATVYHVTHVRYAELPEGQGYSDEGRLQDRYYGTVSAELPDGSHSADNCIARGGFLEIRKCLVGGSSAGVETGEVHKSCAPVMNYRFEYSAR